jgi:hypothetical protein
MGVHADVDAGDGAVDDRAILQLNGHRFVGQFHQEADELHLRFDSGDTKRILAAQAKTKGKGKYNPIITCEAANKTEKENQIIKE